MSLLKNCNGIIGNSSSGIIEAPSFKIPAINIGDRQTGRIKAESVIDCKPIKNEIIEVINQSVTIEFQEKLKEM